MNYLKAFFLFSFLAGMPAWGHEGDAREEADKDDEQVKEGNFSLPTSQQPGPLIGFGQNIIDKGQTQAFAMEVAAQGRGNYQITVTPSLLYAVADNFSLFFNVPFAPSNKDNDHYSHGTKDIFVQMEWAYYNKNSKTALNQATVVAAVYLPTGASRAQPPTGFGATSFFAGLTFAHTDIEWYYFASPGVVIPTKHGSTRFGEQLLYQAGLGRNLYGSADWIIDWMVEIDGIYAKKDKIHGITDPNSGGNTILLTPSLWVSGKSLILQAGISFPIMQNLYGSQAGSDYAVNINLGWTF